MGISTGDAVRDQLYKANQTFRELVNKHQNCEKRLNELSELTHPSDDEVTEESTLKKKKLKLKDEIHNMLQKHTKTH